MVTWGDILNELKQQAQGGGRPNFDAIRRRELARLAGHTERNTILYAAAHLQKPEVGQGNSITDSDLEGFMEVIHGLTGDSLDLILHSPGGVAEAADSIVQYLRSKFPDFRVIVPHMAMSAATMVACAANTIIMARHSKLGPIDPQLLTRGSEGRIALAPAVAILDQFERAKEECKDQSVLPVWYPILKQYAPALLEQASNAIRYSEERVAEWLETGMFAGQSNAGELAKTAAAALNDHRSHRTHGRPLMREYLRDDLSLNIEDLEDDQGLQDCVLSVYHATMHTLGGTQATKIIENHRGVGFVQLANPIEIKAGNGQPQQQQQPGGSGAKKKKTAKKKSKRR